MLELTSCPVSPFLVSISANIYFIFVIYVGHVGLSDWLGMIAAQGEWLMAIRCQCGVGGGGGGVGMIGAEVG